MAVDADSLIERLRGTLGRMELALGSISDALAWTDPEGRLQWCNTAFDALIGRPRIQVLGANVVDLLPLRQRGAEISLEAHPVSLVLREGTHLMRTYEYAAGERPRILEIHSSPLVVRGQQDAAVLVIRDMTEQKRVEEENRRRIRRMEMLQVVTFAANESDKLDEAFQLSLDAVCEQTGWPIGYVSLAGIAPTMAIPTNILHVRNPTRFQQIMELAEADRSAPWTGLRGRVLDSGRPEWALDMTREEDPPYSRVAAACGIKAAFAFPVLIGKKVVAVLEFFAEDAKEPDAGLLDVMEQIGVQLGRVIERKRSVADLRRARDEMEQRVLERTADLERLNDELHLEVEERRRAEQVKDKLVSTVSHELRTPLTSLKGFAELMLKREYPLEKRQHFLGIIEKEATRLTNLINEFLDLQRMESGRQTYLFERVEAKALLEETLGIFCGGNPGHMFFLEAGEGLPPVRADADRISQVLTNLLSNAVKFSPNGGEIRVGARSEGENLLVWVADSGIGVPHEFIPRLFEKFARADSTETRKIGGTGLGLALVKEIVLAHGGKVWAETEHGKGSTFFFTLAVFESPRVSAALPLAGAA